MSTAAVLAEFAPNVPIPPEIPVEHVDAYIAEVRRLVAEGGDAAKIAREYASTVRQLREAGIDPFDPAQQEIAFEGSAEDAIRWLEGQACVSSG
jgi:hypothetical protein